MFHGRPQTHEHILKTRAISRDIITTSQSLTDSYLQYIFTLVPLLSYPTVVCIYLFVYFEACWHKFLLMYSLPRNEVAVLWVCLQLACNSHAFRHYRFVFSETFLELACLFDACSFSYIVICFQCLAFSKDNDTTLCSIIFLCVIPVLI